MVLNEPQNHEPVPAAEPCTSSKLDSKLIQNKQAIAPFGPCLASNRPLASDLTERYHMLVCLVDAAVELQGVEDDLEPWHGNPAAS